MAEPLLSAECCSIPQVVSNYEPKGATDVVDDGLKIYTVGMFFNSKKLNKKINLHIKFQ